MDIDNVLRSPLPMEEDAKPEPAATAVDDPVPSTTAQEEAKADENDVPVLAEEEEGELPAPPSLLPQVSESEAWIIEVPLSHPGSRVKP